MDAAEKRNKQFKANEILSFLNEVADSTGAHVMEAPGNADGSPAQTHPRFRHYPFQTGRLVASPFCSDVVLILTGNSLYLGGVPRRDVLAISYMQVVELACLCGLLPFGAAYVVAQVVPTNAFPSSRTGTAAISQKITALAGKGIAVWVDWDFQSRTRMSTHQLAEVGAMLLPAECRDASGFLSNMLEARSMAWCGGGAFMEERADDILADYMMGQFRLCMEDSAFGNEAGYHNPSFTWQMLDALCFEQSEAVKRHRVASVASDDMPYFRHVDFSPLLEAGGLLASSTDDFAEVQGVASVWKACCAEAGIRIERMGRPGDEELLTRMLGAADALGIEPRVAAYLSGVPMADIVGAPSRKRR